MPSAKNKENSMNLYIGNLSLQATDADVQQAFAAFGQVQSATRRRPRWWADPLS